MMKTPEQQVKDAQYYLQDGTLNVPRANEILDEINWGQSEVPEGIEVAVVVGHVYGEPEQMFNYGVAGYLKVRLEEKYGCFVYLHVHGIKAYTARINEMTKAIVAEQPHNKVCVELHYNGSERKEAEGHHFQYNRSEKLARSMRDAWENHFPASKRTMDDGLYHNTDGNGSYFLKKAPGWACLCEPFFWTNPKERAFYSTKQKAIAYAYAEGIVNFLKTV